MLTHQHQEGRHAALVVWAILAATPVTAQNVQEGGTKPAAPPTTMVEHSEATPWWLSGQLNLIGQAHGSFPALYTGPNSFRPMSEGTVSRVLTLYTGLRLGHGWEVFLDLESVSGRGLSDAFGLAGFTDLDVIRNPALGSRPYVARLMMRKIIALSSATCVLAGCACACTGMAENSVDAAVPQNRAAAPTIDRKARLRSFLCRPAGAVAGPLTWGHQSEATPTPEGSTRPRGPRAT